MGKTIVFLVGPTASGKSVLALKIAPLINAEIISCDSMQVYRGMDIGTAKPQKELRRKIKHHLIDIVSPNQEFSAFDFYREAMKVIEDLFKKGKIPLIVGGSGLYFKALVDGIFEGPGKDPELREKLYQEAQEKGIDLLYERLKEIDPSTAGVVHPNDLRRIVRALEVYFASGIPISVFKTKTKGAASLYNIIVYGISREREQLQQRIERRVEEMFARGLVDEVRRLKEIGLSKVAAQGLGYKEILEYLQGKVSLEEAKKILKRNTRLFAKRQISWFRADKRIKWISIDEETDLDDLARKLAREISLCKDR